MRHLMRPGTTKTAITNDDTGLGIAVAVHYYAMMWPEPGSGTVCRPHSPLALFVLTPVQAFPTDHPGALTSRKIHRPHHCAEQSP